MPPRSRGRLRSTLLLLSLLPGCLAVGNDPSRSSEVTDVGSLLDGASQARVSEPETCFAGARDLSAALSGESANDRDHLPRAVSRARFVYSTNQNSHDVSTFAVNASGSLSQIGTPVGVGRYPDAILLLPSGTGLFVANHGSDSVSGFKVDPVTGSLSGAGPAVATAKGPTALVANAAGSVVYVGSDDATFRTPNVVTTYRVDSETGGLIDRGAIDTGGAGLVAMVADPAGRFLYTANALSDDVSVFSIDPCNGALSKVGANVASAFPLSLTIDPLGKYLYVAAGGSDPSVQTFAIDSVSGALAPIATLKGIAAPWELKALQLDATGRFLFVVTVGRRSASSISTLLIDPQTGIPSSARASSVPSGANAFPVAVDPSGRFAYVGNFGSNDISAYALDGASGALNPLGTFRAGAAPAGLAISSGRVL